MKVLIAGGGTGGHLFPGIAVAEEFLHSGLARQVLFVGTERGIEARIVPAEGYPLRFVRARGFVGKSLADKMKSLFLAFLSVIDSFRIIDDFEPDIVIGVGGYASAPTVFTAHLRGIPTMILEQNSVPGTANRLLGRFVDAVAATYQESTASFPGHKTYLTGNPVRRSLSRRDPAAACAVFGLDGGRFTILVLGGSTGARSVNTAMVEALKFLNDLKHNIQFIHQTGRDDHPLVADAYRGLGFRAVITPFVDTMAEAYSLADIVVCRAGATTLAEIIAMGKPSILIPYPFAAGGHQELNARKLVDLNAALMIRDSDLSGRALADSIRRMYGDYGLRSEMQRVIVALHRDDARARIVSLAMSLLKKR